MKFFDTLLSAVAPHECLGCMAEGPLLCAACIRTLPRPDARCYKCHAPSLAFATCTGCRPVTSLSSVLPAVRYEELAKDILWKLKFARSLSAADEIAQLIETRLRLARLMQRLPDGVIITHAPTATSRVRQRGYDQAALIARGLSRRCHVPYAPLLARRGNQKQIGATKEQRAQQLAGAFYVRSAAKIRGAHIILIDDVVTTGATLETAARALMDAGVHRVDAVVFAQA